MLEKDRLPLMVDSTHEYDDFYSGVKTFGRKQVVEAGRERVARRAVADEPVCSVRVRGLDVHLDCSLGFRKVVRRTRSSLN